MRLLVLSDKESNYLWDSENPKRLEDIDLILSCGDLRPEYLSFIATFTHARFSMCTEITMTAIRKRLQTAVFALKTESAVFRESVSWAWADLSGIGTVFTSTRSRR